MMGLFAVVILMMLFMIESYAYSAGVLCLGRRHALVAVEANHPGSEFSTTGRPHRGLTQAELERRRCRLPRFGLLSGGRGRPTGHWKQKARVSPQEFAASCGGRMAHAG